MIAGLQHLLTKFRAGQALVDCRGKYAPFLIKYQAVHSGILFFLYVCNMACEIHFT